MQRGGLVHHADRGVQYVSIKYTERLATAGIEPSFGSIGDSCDNALAETINGLHKAEVIHWRRPVSLLLCQLALPTYRRRLHSLWRFVLASHFHWR